MMKKLTAMLFVAIMILALALGAGLAEETALTMEGTFESGSVEGGISNEAAIEGFINRAFGIGGTKRAGETRGSRLTGQNAIVYAYLRDRIAEVAAGQISSTVFNMPVSAILTKLSYTAEELGVPAIVENSAIAAAAKNAMYAKFTYDTPLIMDCLMADCPYELYWFDKTVGYSYGTPGISAKWNGSEYEICFADEASLHFDMKVAKEYSVTDAQGTTDFNTDVATKISTAVENADSIVTSNSGKSDYAKLKAYKDAICERVSYNDAAAKEATKPAYGNPWQLIWVFDDDASTEVVCEGYSKAFKYLCDKSSFSGAVSSSLVTGLMDGGAHMWNLVAMNDGKRYLVDVTNCDSGTVGYPDHLFMAGYTSHSGNTYTYTGAGDQTIDYTYDSDTLNLYSEAELTVESTDYVPETILSGDCGDNLTWTLVNRVLTISGTGAMADYSSEIPAPWNGLAFDTLIVETGVTSIGDYAFKEAGFAGADAVQLPDGLKTIGDHAFYSADNLSTIHLPDTVESIGIGAFHNTGMDSIEFPSALKTIGSWAFASCGIKVLDFPEGLEIIGRYAFSNSSFESITLPSTIRETGSGYNGYFTVAYRGTVAQARRLNVCRALSNHDWTCSDGVFYKTPSGTCGPELKWEIVGDVLTISGTGPMYDYTEVVDDFSSYSTSPLDDYFEIYTHVVIEAGVTSIGDDAFPWAWLDSDDIILPEGMERIGTKAFFDRNVNELYIPASVTSIGADVVSKDSPHISCVYGSYAYRYAVDNGYEILKLYAPASANVLTLPDDLQTIESQAFANLPDVEAVRIPAGVTSIADDAFSGTDIIVIAADGTYAAQWAEAHGIICCVE